MRLMLRLIRLFVLTILCTVCVRGVLAAQDTQPTSPVQLKAAIDKLGDLDYAVRTNAAKTVRRASPSQAVPALAAAAAASPGDEGTPARAALLKEVGRGEDFFRSAVIEALGDYKAAYAFDALVAIARLDGPLQDDAALALGKIGDKRALETLAQLQRSAPRQFQPSIAAAICLLGVNCETHENYLAESLKFADKHLGFQELLRGAAMGLAAVGVAGHAEAAASLFDVGLPSRDPTRAPIALALGTVALRNAPMLLPLLEQRTDRDQAM